MSIFFKGSGPFFFLWVIPAIAFVVLMAIGYFRFLLNLDRRTRSLFIAAGTIFIGGALGIEMIEAMIAERYDEFSPHMIAPLVVEETCEMLGVVLFIYALLDYILRFPDTDPNDPAFKPA